jgi:phenylacetate-CoA ligase
VYSWLVPYVMLPLYDRLSGRQLWAEVLRLRELQWRSREELEARAIAKLRPLLEHAAAHVPHYRELFRRAGLGPGEVRTAAALSRLPITTKTDLRAGFPARVVAQNLPERRRWRMTTSGSSGLPLEFYADRLGVDAWLGCYFFFLNWAGTGIWDTTVAIGSPASWSDNLPRQSNLTQMTRRVVFGERTVRLSGPDLTPTELQTRLGCLSGRPYFIRGYASYVAELGARLLELGAELPSYPRVVINHAETLTAVNAAIIERAFRCRVVNQYSAWEVPQMAQTCPDNAGVLHTNSQRAIVRVVRDDGSDAQPGEVGQVVVTDLGNYVMPFINYETGDRAVAGAPCPCGRGLPTLMSLEGRLVETIRVPNGRIISPGALGQFMIVRCQAIPYVWEYQAVQTAPAAVALRIVPTPRFNPEFASKLSVDLESLLGTGVKVDIETVDRIPRETSGKRLIIKSGPLEQ